MKSEVVWDGMTMGNECQGKPVKRAIQSTAHPGHSGPAATCTDCYLTISHPW